VTNTADLRDPMIRKALRKAGLLNAAGPVQASYLSTADLRAAYAPRTPMERTTMRRTPIKRVRGGVEGVFEIVTPRGDRYAWPEMYLPEEPQPGWNRRVHACFRWQVEDYLADKGWSYWHCDYEPGSEPYFWDLVCHRDREVWFELKVRGPKGNANGLSAGQWEFYQRLLRAGCEAHVITWPDDWEKFKELVA